VTFVRIERLTSRCRFDDQEKSCDNLAKGKRAALVPGSVQLHLHKETHQITSRVVGEGRGQCPADLNTIYVQVGDLFRQAMVRRQNSSLSCIQSKFSSML
jgi:hypothetical protein